MQLLSTTDAINLNIISVLPVVVVPRSNLTSLKSFFYVLFPSNYHKNNMDASILRSLQIKIAITTFIELWVLY